MFPGLKTLFCPSAVREEYLQFWKSWNQRLLPAQQLHPNNIVCSGSRPLDQ